MYLRLRDKSHSKNGNSEDGKMFLGPFVFALLVTLAVVFSSLSGTETEFARLADSLNSNRVIYFDFSSYELKEESFYLLDRLAERLKHNRAAKIEITGHTDSIGSESFNDALSIRRAEAVKLYLINLKVNSDQVITDGKGFKIPAADNNTDENRSLNRRVEFLWMMPPIAKVIEIDESFANTGSWKSTRDELKGELSVRDTAGEPVTGIEENDVSAVLKWKQNEIEDSADGSLKLFPIDDKKKIAFTFTMDYSPSMYDSQFNVDARKTEKIIQMEKAVLTFIDNMDQKNFGKIIKFGRVIDEIIRFTKSKEQLRNAVNNRCYPRAGTALYKSIYLALLDTTYNSNPTIMKTVIAFTDGEENSSGFIRKDSIYRHSVDKGIRVFTVGLIDEINHSIPVGMNSPGEADLVEISKRTGGFYYWARDPSMLPTIYKQIYDQIMKSYSVSIMWKGNNLPPKGTPVIAVVRVNVKGVIRTIFKKYVIE